MKVFAIAELRRALFLSVAMVIASVGAVGGQTRPQELVGAWVSVGNIGWDAVNGFDDDYGYDHIIELFKDGTIKRGGEVYPNQWSVENKRLISVGRYYSCDYKVSGYELFLYCAGTDEEGGSIFEAYVKKESLGEYKNKKNVTRKNLEEYKKLCLENARKEQEQRVKEYERRKKEIEKTSYYFTDTRNGQKYRAITIDGKTWMRDNLNYQTGNSWCNGNKESNCKQYGRLYDWNTARTACPAGWRLPSLQDWWDGGLAWESEEIGAFLLGGRRDVSGNFVEYSETGWWWTATEGEKGGSYGMDYYGIEGNVAKYEYDKREGFSVRCIANNAPANVVTAPPVAPSAAAPVNVVTAPPVAPPPAAQAPDGPPVAAVYVTGDVPDYMKSFFGARLLSALVSAGAGVSGDSSAAFLAAAEEERLKRGGALDDGAIRELGERFGVRYVCVASITPVPGAYALSTRVMSVKTGASRYGAEAIYMLATMDDLANAAAALAGNMFGGKRVFAGQPAPQAAAAPAVAPDGAPAAALEPADAPAVAFVVAADNSAAAEKTALEQPIPQADQPSVLARQPKRNTYWIALSADIVGAGILGVGIYEEFKVRSLIDKGKFTKSAKTETVRNVCYAIGTVVLASGITVHIFF